jgi:hypothetical protein
MLPSALPVIAACNTCEQQVFPCPPRLRGKTVHCAEALQHPSCYRLTYLNEDWVKLSDRRSKKKVSESTAYMHFPETPDFLLLICQMYGRVE